MPLTLSHTHSCHFTLGPSLVVIYSSASGTCDRIEHRNSDEWKTECEFPRWKTGNARQQAHIVQREFITISTIKMKLLDFEFVSTRSRVVVAFYLPQANTMNEDMMLLLWLLFDCNIVWRYDGECDGDCVHAK